MMGAISRLKLTGADANLVRSVGALVRVIVLGLAVAEIDYVRPLVGKLPTFERF